VRTMTTQWTKSSIDHKAFDELRLKTVISEATNTIGWRVPPKTKVESRPEENEVVSFAHFHSFWFRVPTHPLLHGYCTTTGSASTTSPHRDPPPLHLHHAMQGLPRSPSPL
jgi:hypothetical protein